MIQITIQISNRCIEPSDHNNLVLAIDSPLKHIVPYLLDLNRILIMLARRHVLMIFVIFSMTKVFSARRIFFKYTKDYFINGRSCLYKMATNAVEIKVNMDLKAIRIFLVSTLSKRNPSYFD